MEFNNFKNNFIKFFDEKENITLKIINDNVVQFIHEEYNYKFDYNIKIFFEYFEKCKCKSKDSYVKLSSIFNFDINLLKNLTDFNENQLLKIFDRNKIT